MENNLKPEDNKQEFCRVKIKEEVSFELIEEHSFIDEIKEEVKEEKDCFDLTHVQSLEESVLVNQIKKEDLNNTDENNDKECIKEEEEIDYVWPEEDIKETDPLALPEIKYFVIMENNLKPEDNKQEFCRVKIKEEVSFELIGEQSFIDEIKEEVKEEKDCFDLTHVQSLEESVLVNQIKKEALNNTDENNDKECIKEEEEIDYVWPEEDIKETDPLALPEIKYFVIMENNLKPEDNKQEFCRVKIKEEVSFELIEEQSFIDEIKEEVKEEKDCFDLTHVQSLEESVLVNQIKMEALNNTDENNDKECIKEEEEIDYVWPEEDIKETDPLALPEIKYFVIMENNLKPEDNKQEFCRVKIKEEVSFELIEEQSFIDEIKEEVKEEKDCFDLTHVQSLEESVLVNQIKMEALNNTDENNDKECIKEEEEIDYVWPEEDIKETDPLALPEIKYDSKGVQSSGITLHCNESFISLNPLNESSKMGKSRTRHVGCHRKNKMPADTNNSSLSYTGGKPYSCNVCSFKCSQSGNLKRHMLIHTGEKPYFCNVCSFKMSQSSNLKKHMLIHTGEKPYFCYVCSFKCSQDSHLKRHMLTHTGEKAYSCNVCSFKCSQSGNLKIHMHTHAGEKPYSCNVCSFKCSQSGDLKRHMLTHTGEKPYSCNVCSFQCSQSGDLKRHMRTHTGEKPFSCNFCSF